jgi:alpha-galactosidase
MRGARVVASHARAGSVEPTRLAVRHGETTAAATITEALLSPGRIRVGPFELQIDVAAGGEVASVRAALRNASDRDVALESVVLGFRWTGHAARSFRFLRHGWQSWSFTGARDLDERGEPEFPSGSWLRGMHHVVGSVPPDRRGWHESDLATVVGATPTGPACLVGVLEGGRSFGVVYARRDGDALRLEAELCVGALLPAGATRELEPVRVALGDDASALLEAYAEAHGRAAGARTARPLLAGWCTWYHFFHDVTEDDVRRNLDALASGREAIPVDVVQIDDGYQAAVGDWLDTNAKFPSGLAALAAEIRAAGFVPGVWTAPFCVVPESRMFRDQRDWLLRNAGDWFRGLLHPSWSQNGSVFVLDTSRAEVERHLRDLFHALVAMGFAYLKLDFLYTAAMSADAWDATASRAERFRRGLDAIRAGAGEEAFLLGCGCPLGAAVGVVDAMRIGPDVAPTWKPDPALAIPGLEETVPATRSAVRNVLARVWTHRRLWLNDPDCLMARRESTQLSREERRTLAAVIAATGGLVVLSDDVPVLGDEDCALFRDTLSVARSVDRMGVPGCARAVDLLGGDVARGVCAATGEGGFVAVVNADDEPVKRRLEPAALGLEPLREEPRAVLGSGGPPGGEGPGLERELASHDSALFRVKRAFPLAIFCDFDGTFSVQDVGSTLAVRHAPDLRPVVWARYERGEITPWEYNMEVLDGLPLPLPELEAFLQTVELDPGARELVHWCEAKGVPFRVLSDGFDYNLNRLQVIHDLRFAYDANHLRYEDGRWRIEGAHPNPSCGCGTGTCKRGRIDAFRADHPGAKTVHIGNGRVSDTCGALAADVAFAKDSLALELQKRGVAYEPFETLRDVIPRLQQILDDAA